MSKQKKKIDPLIPVLSAIAVVMAVILAVLLLKDGKTNVESDKEPPTVEATTLIDATRNEGSEKETQPLGTEDAPEVTEVPEETGTGAQNPEETEPEETKDDPQKNTEPEETTGGPQKNTEPEETTGGPQNNTEPVMNGTAVNTPYCVLRIPEEWVDRITVQITEEEWDTSVAFFGNQNGEKILLYTLHFGGAAGDPVGTWLTDEDVLMDVTLEVHDITENASWSTEDRDTVYAMQESLNYVLKGLEDYPAFTAAQV